MVQACVFAAAVERWTRKDQHAYVQDPYIPACSQIMGTMI